MPVPLCPITIMLCPPEVAFSMEMNWSRPYDVGRMRLRVAVSVTVDVSFSPPVPEDSPTVSVWLESVVKATPPLFRHGNPPHVMRSVRFKVDG
jgi:hypothetical protein